MKDMIARLLAERNLDMPVVPPMASGAPLMDQVPNINPMVSQQPAAMPESRMWTNPQPAPRGILGGMQPSMDFGPAIIGPRGRR